MYDIYLIRGRLNVETKVVSNEKVEVLKTEYLALALEGDVEIRQGDRVLTISELARAFIVPEYRLIEYLKISNRWLELNFFLNKGRWLYD